MENNQLFSIENVTESIKLLEDKIVSPYVKGTYSTLGGINNISILLTISKDAKSEWAGGILQNSNYAMFHISHTGSIERFSGNLPKMRKRKVASLEQVIEILNDYIIGKEKYDLGSNVEVENEEKQIKYKPASSSGFSINTFVPASMYNELNSFYDYLKSYILSNYNMTVEQFVAIKLHYNSVDDLFYSEELDEAGNRKGRFAKEQIDAIATAIYNAEANNQGIIIADQTGVGKGRTAAGLIRYAILEARVLPLFATDKKHLINDIYRDLIDIGFEANIPVAIRKKNVVKKDEYTQDEIIKEIKKDIAEFDDLRIDYSLPDDDEFSLSKLTKYPDRSKFANDEEFDYYEEIIEEIIGLYEQHLIENGIVEIVETEVPETTIERLEKEALAKGKIRVFPFVPSMIDIENQEGNLLYRKTNRDELNKIFGYTKDSKGKHTQYDFRNPPSMDDIKMPSIYKLIAVPYSQIRSETEDVAGLRYTSPKYRFYQAVLKDSILVLDEAHNAAGGSATYRVASKLISQSKMSVFLSATFAKRPDNYPLYAKKTSISESRLSDDELIEVFKKGETALQEAVSVELTRNGQLLRRDKQIAGETDYFYVYDDEVEYDGKRIGTQQRARLDRVAELFKDVLNFQNLVSEEIKKYRSGLPKREMDMPIEGTKSEIKAARTIKALSFQLFNFFLVGIKIDQTMYMAKNKMTNGRKLVFAIANTMESALKNMPKTFKTGSMSDRYKIGDTIENDFKLYLAYMLFYTMRFKLVKENVDDEGRITEVETTQCVFDSSHDLAEAILVKVRSKYDELLTKILNTDTYISISPIDVLIKNINGYTDSDDYIHSIEEITGRTIKLEFLDDEMRTGRIVKRESKPTTQIVKDFNSNEIDHLIINQSGAVGISMHPRPVGRSKIFYPTKKESYTEAKGDGEKKVEIGFPKSLKNKDEIKKRCMIILQMELDISKEVQKIGRISRTGQVYEPEYVYAISAIPSESRLTALMERKLRSLSANTSGNQQQASDLFEQEDFFGEIAVNPFKDAIKTTQLQALFSQSTGKDIENALKEDIKNFTKILYFIHFETQKKFYETFSEELNRYIIEQKNLGVYVGQLGNRDFKSETKLKLPFFIGNENSLTSFGRHSFIEKIDADVPVQKTTQRDVKELFDYFLQNVDFGYVRSKYDTIDEYKSGIGSQIETLYNEASSAIKENIFGLKATIDYYETLISRMNVDLDNLSKLLPSVSEALGNEKDKAEKFNEINGAFVKAKEDDDFEKAKELKPLKEKAQEEYEKAKEVVKGITYTMKEDGEVVEPKDIENKINSISNKIERNKKYIVAEQDKIEKAEAELVDKQRLYELAKKYYEMSGAICIETQFIQDDLYEDEEVENELGEKVTTSVLKGYKYEKVNTKYVVIFGVTFKDRNLTASNIILHFATMSNSSTQKIPFSQIHPTLSSREAELGKRGLNEFSEIIKMPYNEKDFWNDLVKSEKSTTRQTRWILSGSILRAYKAGIDSSFKMELTKYTTKERDLKMGCIISNLKVDSNSPSLYDDLEQQYNSGKEYSILFEGSVVNTMNFIAGKMYNYYIEQYYEMARTGNKDSMIERWNIRNTFIFQISTSKSPSFIEIKVNDEIMQMAKLLWNNVDSNSLIDSIGVETIPQMTDEEFMSNIISVKIISGEVKITDAFAMMAISKGQAISYTTQKASPIKEAVKMKDNYYSSWDLSWSFNTLFVTNSTQVRQFMLERKVAKSSVNLLELDSFQSFLECIASFEEFNALPTLPVSSYYFQKYSSIYSFDDSIDRKVQSDSAQTNSEEQISNLIEELSKLI
jgi:hypothetical protein